ncbi:MAG: tripartite tricarboxylate transporter TctB family protein [Sphaerochaeta sp.]|nr:tripartite tricarboxylate transporter TctB family protein [Sphaerochaeta sp.]
MTKIWKNSRLVFSLLLLTVGIIAFIDSFLIKEGVKMARGGDFMPRIVTFLWVVFALIVAIKARKEQPAKSMQTNVNKDDQKGFGLTLLLLIAYVFLVGILGFLLSSIITVTFHR